MGHLGRLLGLLAVAAAATADLFESIPPSRPPPPRLRDATTRLLAPGSCDAAGELGAAVVFGGWNPDLVSGELYTLDLASLQWSLTSPMSPTRPAARARHAAALAADGAVLYVFGGVDDGDFLRGDAWAYDFEGQDWRELLPSSAVRPVERVLPAAFLPDGDGGLWVAGGVDAANAPLQDLWRLDLDSFQWQQMASWNDSSGPTLTMFLTPVDLGDGEHWLFIGGADASWCEDAVWRLSLATFTWDVVANASYEGVERWAPAFVPVGRQLFALFGWDDDLVDAVPADSVLTLDLDTFEWAAVADVAVPDDVSVRDSTQGVYSPELGAIVVFGGWGPDDMLNSAVAFNVSTSAFTSINADQLYPTARAGMSLVTVGGSFFVFGGELADGSLSNELWRGTLSVSSGDVDWELLQASSVSPDPRAYHSCAAYGVEMLCFGGLGEGSALYNDLWALNVLFETWADVSPSAAPSARHGHAMVAVPPSADTGALDAALVLFGGLTLAAALDDVWVYTTRGEWALADGIAAGPSARGYAAACFASDPQGGDALMVVGGRTRAEEVQEDVWLLGLAAGEWAEAAPAAGADVDPWYVARSDASLACTDDFAVLAGGTSAWGDSQYTEIEQLTLSVNPDGGQLEYDLLELAAQSDTFGTRSNLATLMAGNSVGFFGGSQRLTDATPLSAPSNHMGAAAFAVCAAGAASTACAPCPAGFIIGDPCEACPAGSYSETPGSTECTACPAGFYGVLEGATSLLQCLPCPAGTASDDASGAAECEPCADDEYCPLAATTPVPEALRRSVYTLSELQPQTLSTRESVVDSSSRVLLLVFGGLLGAAVAGLLALARVAHNVAPTLRRLDKLFQTRHPARQYTARFGLQSVRQTSAGGLMTVAFAIAALGYVCVLSVPVLIDNVREEQSLLPNTMWFAREPAYPTADMTITVALEGYRAECAVGDACSADIAASWPDDYSSWVLSAEDMALARGGGVPEAPAGELSCEQDDDADRCEVTWACNDCAMPGVSATLQLDFTSEFSFASDICWSVEASSSFVAGSGPDGEATNSSVSNCLLPEDGYSFRGTAPSTIDINAIQSLYQFADSGNEHSGFHVELLASEVGSLVSEYSFSNTNGVGVQFVLARAETTLFTKRYTVQQYADYLASVAGAVLGLLGISRLILRYVERGVAAHKKRTGATTRSALKSRTEDDLVEEFAREWITAHGIPLTRADESSPHEIQMTENALRAVVQRSTLSHQKTRTDAV